MSNTVVLEETEILEEIEKVAQNGRLMKVKRVAPLLLLSFALHMVILLILALIKDEVPPPDKTIVVTTKVEKEKPLDDIPPVIEPVEIIKPEKVDVTEDTDEAPVAEDVFEVTEDPLPSDEISEDIFSEIPVESTSPLMVNNFAALTLSGSMGKVPPGAGVFEKRFKRGGGLGGDGPSAASEDAVDGALKWLAEHQESDGSWDAEKYEGHFKWGYHERVDRSVMTSLALLPFLGAGHTERTGKYQKTVKAGVRYINESMAQKEIFTKGEGHFTRMYGSGLVLMALSETTLFGSSKRSKKNANLIAEYLIDAYMDKPGQGWHYNGGGDDFSVSGWVALGLKSAKYAGLKVMSTDKASKVMNGYRKWTHEVMTDPTTGNGKYRSGGGKSDSMTLVGMFAKQFLGYPLDDPFLKKASENVLPRVNKLLNGEKVGDVYQIYYGTLAAYQQNGLLWASWKRAMEPTLVGSQLKGDPKKLGGSWEPTSDHTGRVVGRVGTTALMALCLEVYYRHPRFSDENG